MLQWEVACRSGKANVAVARVLCTFCSWRWQNVPQSRATVVFGGGMLQWKGQSGCGQNAVHICEGMCPRLEPQQYLEVACCSGRANVAVARVPCTFCSWRWRNVRQT